MTEGNDGGNLQNEIIDRSTEKALKCDEVHT
jgi:hypothetical protein